MSPIRFIPNSPSSTSAGSNSPLANRVKKTTPTARTSGSAKGSLMSGGLARLANARPTATPVAGGPPLVGRSQVSLSGRGIYALLSEATTEVISLFNRLYARSGTRNLGGANRAETMQSAQRDEEEPVNGTERRRCRARSAMRRSRSIEPSGDDAERAAR